MRKGLLRLSLLGLALASACADDPTPSDTQTIGGDGSRIHRSPSGRLTAPSTAAPEAVVRDFLTSHVGSAAGQLKVVSQTTPRAGISHLRFEQTVGGLRVEGAYVKAAITTQGELVQVIENLAPAAPGVLQAAAITHQDALAAAMKELGYDFAVPDQTAAAGQKQSFAKGTEFYREPVAERVAYVDAHGALRQGYLVETWSQRGNQLDHTLVGSNGQIVSSERRTANDSYNVFVEDPGKGSQTVVAGPAPGGLESPSGWLATAAQTSTNVTGNNAHAYLDTDNNGAPDAGGTAVTDGNFLTAADLASSPSTSGNRNVAIQNLFYLNNRVHDVLYRHGFTEAAGNFQEDNFGRGGVGSDSVNAEAQDGGGLDNANFSTPSDGSNPRMQMYLWSGATPPHRVTIATGYFGAWGSSFGAAITQAGITGPLANVNDGVGTGSDGCEASPVGSLTGKVALVDRGTCNFTVKVKNAQAAGAIAVLIANTDASGAFSPGGTDRKVKIPSAMVTQADGASLRAVAGTSARLHTNPDPALRLDGDLDSDIVFHEYGHGLTWRMIGSMSGPMSGAIGEGASDVLAFLINQDPIVGEYAYANPLGIRRYPYDAYPLTYGDVTGGEVHNDGEVYAAILWAVYQEFLAAGYTADDVLDYFVQGMNFTPAAPAFEDMRDGMLQAAAGTGHECRIWKAFAQFGVGVGADGVVTKGGRGVSITESFVMPASCP